MSTTSVSKALNLQEIPTVKPLKMEYASNVPKEPSLTFKGFASQLIPYASPTTRATDFALLAMLASTSIITVNVSKDKLQLEIPTAKLSRMESALNAPKDPSSTPSEFASLLTPPAKLTILKTEDVSPATPASNSQSTANAWKVWLLKLTPIAKNSRILSVLHAPKDQ